MRKFIPTLSFIILILITVPTVASALGTFDLIVCDGTKAGGECTFSSLITLFQNGVTALVKIATMVTAIALIVMGVKLLTSGGDVNARKDVQKRGKMILIGYVVILSAWLIVYYILKALVGPDYILLNP